MRRVLGSLILASLLVVGAAGCGGDGDSDSSKEPAAAETASETGEEGGGDEVVAYCDAVDDYIAKVREVQEGGGDAADLAAEGQELTRKASALATAGLSADDAEKVGECTQESSEALTPG